MTPESRSPAGRHNIRYTLLEPLREDEAHFTFEGPFEGQTVNWNARLLTLARAKHAGQTGPNNRLLRPFIEIGDPSPTGRPLTVALEVARIDVPAILRTIIMIRQYKRLRHGRHEFGEPGPPGAD